MRRPPGDKAKHKGYNADDEMNTTEKSGRYKKPPTFEKWDLGYAFIFALTSPSKALHGLSQKFHAVTA